MRRKTLVLLLLLIVLIILPAQAHPGRTDANGGHNSDSGYHYHHGYDDHQHPNGVCPYNFDDRTGQSSGSSSSGGSTRSSSSHNSNTVAATPKDTKSGVDPAALYFPILAPATFLVYKLFYAIGKFLFSDNDVGCLGGLAASAFFLVILFVVGGGAFWLCHTLAPHISAGVAWCINIAAVIIFIYVLIKKFRRSPKP